MCKSEDGRQKSEAGRPETSPVRSVHASNINTSSSLKQHIRSVDATDGGWGLTTNDRKMYLAEEHRFHLLQIQSEQFHLRKLANNSAKISVKLPGGQEL